MKYYEIYVSSFWGNDCKYIQQELTVEKETPKQIKFKTTSAYIQCFNKSKLLKVIEDTYQSYIIYPEGKEAEARKLLSESLERQLDYHKKKVEAFNYLIKEVDNNGKKEHN